MIQTSSGVAVGKVENGQSNNLLHKWFPQKPKSISSSPDRYLYGNSDKVKLINGQKLGAWLVLATFSIVFIKFCVLLTGKPMLLVLTDISIDMMTKVKQSSESLMTNYGSVLWPFICGIAVSIFTWAMVYFDSDVPGISPPSPLSPRKTRYRNHRERTCHLSYMMSIASGCTVFLLMYLSNGENNLSANQI